MFLECSTCKWLAVRQGTHRQGLCDELISRSHAPAASKFDSCPAQARPAKRKEVLHRVWQCTSMSVRRGWRWDAVESRDPRCRPLHSTSSGTGSGATAQAQPVIRGQRTSAEPWERLPEDLGDPTLSTRDGRNTDYWPKQVFRALPCPRGTGSTQACEPRHGLVSR